MEFFSPETYEDALFRIMTAKNSGTYGAVTSGNVISLNQTDEGKIFKISPGRSVLVDLTSVDPKLRTKFQKQSEGRRKTWKRGIVKEIGLMDSSGGLLLRRYRVKLSGEARPSFWVSRHRLIPVDSVARGRFPDAARGRFPVSD